MDPKKSSENIEGTFQDAIDPMTGFLNRSGFYNFLSNLLGMASSENKCILLFTVKLLNYKRIIELWSETESKSIIGATAKMISHCLRGRAVCSRSSEDRFMIAGEVPDDGLTTANSVREELVFRFDNMNKVSGKEYTVNPEISYIIIEPNSGITPDEALSRIIAKSRENADSRTLGRFLHVREEEEDPGLKNAVTRILDNNEFDYHFQPIVSANNGDIVGYEALMRMPKEYGVSPLTLLKYASEENRLSDVERATMFNVMKRTKQLSGILGNRKIFINSIPGHYLSDEEFRSLEKKYDSLFDRIVIEVTEETNMEKATVDLLSKRTKTNGIQVAVDDFGSGYSNVSNLLKFLPNYVKIDRFLISDIHADPRKQHFVNTIIQFAHDNGFQALAEGVETSEELNAVIRMGIDLIQGYYTAKPAPDLLTELPENILSEISRANLDMLSNNCRQKVYLVRDETTLSLVDLSLQKYNVLLLSGGDITLVGNSDFTAAVSIRVKDNSSCRLTICNVNIGDVDTTPCIDIGSNSSLVLNVEDYNVFTGNGIRVPDSSKLLLEGTGVLSIKPTFTNAYGIGNEYRSAFGKIESNMKGTLEIIISGENCICIGGKSSEQERAIDFHSGIFKSVCAASNCVCIGSYEGKIPVYIEHMDIAIDVRINKGAMIGSMHGEQDTHVSNTLLRIFGSGSKVAGIGSLERTGGRILIRESTIDISLKGWNILALGAEEGNLLIDCNHSRLLMTGEGNIATGIGCRDYEAEIKFDNVGIDMCLYTANCVIFGCRPEAFTDRMNSFTIKRDGYVVDREKWFC